MKIKSLYLSCLILWSVSAYAQTPVKKVLLEEFTTSLCGFCPPKSYDIIQWHQNHPNSIFMTIHEGSGKDSMSSGLTNTIFTSLRPAGGWFAPALMIDRAIYPWKDSVCPYMSVSGFDTIALRVMNEPSPVDIQILGTYDSTQNKINVTVNVKFVSQVPNGEYRLNLFLLEDSVTGIGYPGYDQNCYDASFASTHYPNLSYTDGHIIGYPHRHVLRNTLTGNDWGTTATTPSIPASPIVGTSYVYTLSTPFIVLEKYCKTRLSLVASVNHYVSGSKTENYVLNANSIKLTSNFSTEVINIKELATIYKIYPNPTKGIITLTSHESSPLSIRVIDLTGRIVFEKENVNSSSASFDLSYLNDGLYLIQIISNKATSTHKIIIQK